MSHTLLLQLAAPMQSWGHRSRFDNRDTGLEPTRSGIIGLLCAALGWDRDTDLTPFEELLMGVRVDRPGRMAVDYHTATPIWRDGPEAATVVTDRFYLADARFLVGLQSHDVAWLERLEAALHNPQWPLYFGRKAFAPALPLHLPGTSLRAVDLVPALQQEPWRALTRAEYNRVTNRGQAWQEEPLRLVTETADPRQGVPISDVPRHFGRRNFGIRYLKTSFHEPTSFALHEVSL